MVQNGWNGADDCKRLADYANEKWPRLDAMTASSVIECLRGVTHLRDDQTTGATKENEMISFDNGISLVENRKRKFVTSHPSIHSRVTCGNEYRKVVKGINDNLYLSMFNSAADAEYAFEVMKEWMTVSWEHRLADIYRG